MKLHHIQTAAIIGVFALVLTDRNDSPDRYCYSGYCPSTAYLPNLVGGHTIPAYGYDGTAE